MLIMMQLLMSHKAWRTPESFLLVYVLLYEENGRVANSMRPVMPQA